MDFRILMVLAMIALQAPVSCRVSLIGNFDPQDYIVEGTVVTLNCTVEDRNGTLATIIDGSQAIFDCPSMNTIVSNRLYLRHSHMESARAVCGDFVSGRITEVELNGSLYIAQIDITTTIAMNGGYVECRERVINDKQRILMPNIVGIVYNYTRDVGLIINKFRLIMYKQ